MDESNNLPDTLVVVPEPEPRDERHQEVLARLDAMGARLDLMNHSLLTLQEHLVKPEEPEESEEPEEPEEPVEPDTSIDVPQHRNTQKKRKRRPL